ncbi:bifunctional diaminohydroxyphosphoribosylaminopyrimidine deaminase/5-amino-6-(5-phosphoribosylamino)uracil reductase RibD [Quadrisphaera sp. DSM 44207]|uniref:bifunctional diaminohydroxyphosphoribosylaminopyrimidine deaminase/5-amino-6-(5-phosphoribosylamino)uracil reductase RibD n=1 Tax=Quadrisphaera sp. DSM 44207 TaxID=1881057 RepID=UPI00088A4318|nr:diaminohydroxyphosphoribosylaminopyrimidine deaminase / 5-amino-6-(5-phosphoribosylamino)uracil reductase [Quadrisphaera sp. DSM 44207]
MARAVQLSALGLGTTSPNPVVGCVVLDAAGAVAGEGWHRRAGGPHAEVEALAAAGGRARGGTAVVTLEPCRHTGRTGPCTQALLRAGVARVVHAVADPDPVAGGGAAVLAAAGVDVEGGLLAEEAAEVNAAWLHAVRTGRPLVTWKVAATLDGRSAAADGTSRWITSQEARADVHALRSRADAVVVGVGTVLADDPALTARTDPPPARQPLRVVLDARGRTPAGARVRDGAAPTLVLTAADVGAGPGGRGVDLAAALGVLHARGVRSVLLEGGPTLAGAFVDADLVDRVVAYLAPALLGQGPAALATTATGSTIAAARRLRVREVVAVGPDVRITAAPLRA